MKKLLGIIGALALMLGLAACGGFKTNYYRPTAFGENSQCYYINDPAEVVQLQAQGFCDSSWRPSMAPTYWQARYAPYYESAEYRDYYVPQNRRAAYTAYFVSFDRTHASEIRSEQSKAQYKDNKGKTVDGNTVPRGQFGGGVRSKGGQGIRGDNGKSLKKNHDNIVKKAQQAEKKKQDSYNKQNKTKTGSGSSGSNKRSTSGGGIRSGSGSKSSGSRIGSAGRR